MEDRVIKSSGNVFADLGLPEADERARKAELVMALQGLIDRRNLTQAQAANLCGTDQGTLSKVLRGRLNLVSSDRLFRWIGRLGGTVRITVSDEHCREEPFFPPSACPV